MKKFKQFRAEQQYITEVGPFASAMAIAMGTVGLGFAGWKLFKAGKEKIKGYRESKAEKKENREAGITLSIKKFNPETGKDEAVPVDIPPGDKRANVNNEGIIKLEKEEQKKQAKKNKDALKVWKAERDELGMTDKEFVTHKAKEKGDEKRAAAGEKKTPAKEITFKYKEFDREDGKLISVTEPSDKDMFDDEIVQYQKDQTAKAEKQLADYKAAKGEPETTDDAPETGDGEDGLARDDDGNLEKQSDAEDYFEKNKKAPSGWTNAGDEDKPELMTTKDFEKKKEKKPKKVIGTGTKGARTGMAGRTNPKDLKKAGVESKVLSFGEFITEGVMNDLLKAGKSKKDSEITLDDGADIPIDPLTSQILVKYIEGLNSSEKNRTIQQIQRTERAFMKVLGKAHENI